MAIEKPRRRADAEKRKGARGFSKDYESLHKWFREMESMMRFLMFSILRAAVNRWI
jgi:hypothetical protein